MWWFYSLGFGLGGRKRLFPAVMAENDRHRILRNQPGTENRLSSCSPMITGDESQLSTVNEEEPISRFVSKRMLILKGPNLRAGESGRAGSRRNHIIITGQGKMLIK